MNYEHPFPRVSGYWRASDIMEVDITEFKGVLVNALERQVSWDDTDGEVVGHQCNLRYTST